MNRNTNEIIIYVRLLEEGTPVWRPTLAIPLDDGRFKLLATNNYDPKDEDWEFSPGSVVRGEMMHLGGKMVLVAAE